MTSTVTIQRSFAIRLVKEPLVMLWNLGFLGWESNMILFLDFYTFEKLPDLNFQTLGIAQKNKNQKSRMIAQLRFFLIWPDSSKPNWFHQCLDPANTFFGDKSATL